MSQNPDHESTEQTSAQILPFPHQRVRRAAAVATDLAPDRSGSEGLDRTEQNAPTGRGDVRVPHGSDRASATTEPDGDEQDWSDEQDQPVAVDQPDEHGPGPDQDAGLPPILPAWLKDRSEFARQTEWQIRRLWHVVRFHAVRVPAYAGRLAVRSPRGTARVVTGVVRWAFDLEAEPVRMQTVQKQDYEAYRRLVVLTSSHRRARLLILLFPTVVSMAGVLLAWWALGAGLIPWWLPWLAGATVVLGLGVLGRQADKPVVSPAVVPTHVAKLTAEIVIRALGSLGIAEVNRAIARDALHGIPFPSPITRDGPGWRAEVDLPHGVTAPEVIERRDKLASGLRRPLGCVWPEPVSEEHEGRLVVWVGDRDLSRAPAATWPLTKSGTVNLFDPIPFGQDQRGRPVEMTLMFESVLIGAKPRMGKTFAVRVLGLAAALDPTAQLHPWELKGSGDLDSLEPVAHNYGSGIDDPTITRCLDDLRYVGNTELPRRMDTISAQPKEMRPENKVTKQLAARRSLGLHPLVMFIDECQHLFAHPDVGKEAGDLAERIIKAGPAAGIILILSTQRPDAASLPTGVSANAGIRYCLRVMGQTENDMVLGTSSYKNGVRATTFRNRDKGIGYLVGVADDPQIVRGAYLDNPTADRIVARARAARIEAGTLTGYAAGEVEQNQTPTLDILTDVLAVWPEGQKKAWNTLLVQRLAELRPEIYTEWTAEQLTATLKPHGISTQQVWGTDNQGTKRNWRGLTRSNIQNAIAQRDKTSGGGPSPDTD